MEFPPKEDFEGFDSFEAALRSFVTRAYSEECAHLTVWNGFQFMAGQLRYIYGDSPVPTGDGAWNQAIRPLWEQLNREVHGEDWKKIVNAAARAWSAEQLRKLVELPEDGEEPSEPHVRYSRCRHAGARALASGYCRLSS